MRSAVCLILLAVSFSIASGQGLNVTLLGQTEVLNGGGVTDVWGYVDTSGAEYAIVGHAAGVAIVDLSDPSQPNEISDVTTVPGFDVKVWKNYIYSVNGGSGGQGGVVDISDPASPQVVGSFPSAHNIFISEDGYLFAEFFGLKIYDLNPNPTAPALIWSGGSEGHDASAIGNRLFDFHGRAGTNIYDISNISSPKLLAAITDPSISYNHSGWTTTDGQFLFICDELAETSSADITVWDISDVSNPEKVNAFIDENATVHNLYVIDDFAYVSYYTAGFRVFDVSVPGTITMVGEFDTNPASGQGFDGAFGVYPFTPSGNIYVSDMDNGLFVFSFNGTRAYRLFGILKDADTGLPIENARIEMAKTGTVFRSDSEGVFGVAVGETGPLQLKIDAFGYLSQELSLDAVPGTSDSVQVNLQPSPRGSIVGTVTDPLGDPLANIVANLLVNSPVFDEIQQQTTTTDAQGTFVFAGLPISGQEVSYDSLYLDVIFPFAQLGVANIRVEGNVPTQLDLQFQPADLLLVNDDPQANYGDFYKNSLAELNTTFFEWPMSKKGKAVPVDKTDQLNNNIVIWFTGDADRDVLSQIDQQKLATFLDGGGQLFLTGQNIAEALAGETDSFLSERLGVAHGGNTESFIVSGLQDNPVGAGLNVLSTQSGDGANNQTSRDVLVPVQNSGAAAAFTYFQSNDVAGVTVENAETGSKVVFLGFGFESVVSTGQTAPRSQVLQNILNWFDVATDVENPDTDNLPKTFSLEQNYPNPFNPSTTLSYTLAQRSHIAVVVYNLLGQRVRNLVNGVQAAGRHQVLWDGRDEAGDVLPSGIYIYRLESAGLSASKRMLFLK